MKKRLTIYFDEKHIKNKGDFKIVGDYVLYENADDKVVERAIRETIGNYISDGRRKMNKDFENYLHMFYVKIEDYNDKEDVQPLNAEEFLEKCKKQPEWWK